jgi:predicted membrane channel-forming protein YqfA (hemolysin III family)
MKATRGPSRHPKLAMSLYLGMGWLIPIANHPLAIAIPFPALIWLVAGGIAYTTGILFLRTITFVTAISSGICLSLPARPVTLWPCFPCELTRNVAWS